MPTNQRLSLKRDFKTQSQLGGGPVILFPEDSLFFICFLLDRRGNLSTELAKFGQISWEKWKCKTSVAKKTKASNPDEPKKSNSSTTSLMLYLSGQSQGVCCMICTHVVNTHSVNTVLKYACPPTHTTWLSHYKAAFLGVMKLNPWKEEKIQLVGEIWRVMWFEMKLSLKTPSSLWMLLSAEPKRPSHCSTGA